MLTRREFLAQIASLAAATSAPKPSWPATSTPVRAFEHGNPLSEFHYSQVEFRPGLHHAQLEQTHAILMGLDEDALLRPYRYRGGFPAPGFELGGWYSSNERDPGHAFGQWISALSRYCAITGDKETKEKIFRLVKGFSETIEPTGKLYENYGNPSYLYDKLVCGLMDAYQLVGHQDSLRILDRATSAALPHLPGRACVPGDPPNCTEESYTVPENQFIAWQRGGDSRHLEIARKYLYGEFFNPLARGENVLAGRHAYSHVNALCSAAKTYLVLGDEKYLKAARNGFAFVEQQSFVTGAWGAGGEAFLPLPPYRSLEGDVNIPAIDTLSDAVKHLHWHFETPCGAYAHFKLTRYLLRLTKDSHYGDSMERVMYNTVLGALPLNKYGKAFYQSNYHSHARKEYFDGYGNVMEDEWPCCSGTLPQVAADYRISSYFHDAQGVYVNLYIPSTVRWEQGGAQISLAQSGQYPLDDGVALEVTASRPVEFALRLRIPEWAQEPSIQIDGEKISEPVRSGTFTAIRREWKSGNRVELELPRRLELKAVDSQHPNMVALVCGPLVLFAVSEDTPKVTRAQLLAARQQSTGSSEWRADTAGEPLRLVPFWAVKDELYFTYLSV